MIGREGVIGAVILLNQWSDGVIGIHSEQLHFGMSEVVQLICGDIEE